MKHTPFTEIYKGSEAVIGLVYPIGTDYKRVTSELEAKFSLFGYDVEVVQVSSGIISSGVSYKNELERITKYMDLGNKMRLGSQDNGIIALGVADIIHKKRTELHKGGEPGAFGKKLFVINSLKHPEEVRRLREIYEEGFYLIAIDEDEKGRLSYLTKEKRIETSESQELIKRDQDEKMGHGQNTRDTFQLADFFISLTDSTERTKSDVDRMVDIMFGHPYITPTFDEFAMYSAFISSLRSADLSRQVGAVIGRGDEILAMGSNDCPKFGGGLYWPTQVGNAIVDRIDGRDYTRGYDSNKEEQNNLIDEIISKLEIKKKDIEDVKEKLLQTKIKDLTEFGRVVHAEMEALLYCSRNNISTKGATLYATTFPCHNCAKHIIAAGIERVIYVEPYPKSKAFDFYKDSITEVDNPDRDRVLFKPFIGVGPRKFLDFFSLRLSSGAEMIRKNTQGKTIVWNNLEKNLRVRMVPLTYIDKELIASNVFSQGGSYEAERKAFGTKPAIKNSGRSNSKLASVEKNNRGGNRTRVQKKRNDSRKK